MTEKDQGSKAHDWIFGAPHDPDELPRNVELDRVLKERRRKKANMAAYYEWAKRITAGGVIGTFAYQVAERMGWL